MRKVRFTVAGITETRERAKGLSAYHENRGHGTFIVEAPSYSDDGVYMGEFTVMRTLNPHK